MALTKSFKETVAARLQSDPSFKQALLAEGISALLDGESNVGKSILRDYVNATIGFETLSQETKIPPKSLMRMLSAKGNPSANNLFAIIHALQIEAGVHFTAVVDGMDRAA
ncbi:MAG: hypothetical protein FD163_2482 [Hyphomonadaceae bacterium]|nr:MAG: hypothetical protein FD128_1870 [Hyphomonadaceae bacterium]KAF0182692.1 MAG: hypothetical protein FD163_2482 [Hyphomonadaceae bacterium]